MADTDMDFNQTPLSAALDATYSGNHAPTMLKHIIVLGWILLVTAVVSAWLERCYKWPKAIFVFVGLTALMTFMTLNALTLYEPYLAVRR